MQPVFSLHKAEVFGLLPKAISSIPNIHLKATRAMHAEPKKTDNKQRNIS
jgi:hypothetical protein